MTGPLDDLARLELARLGKRRSIAKHEYAFRAGEPAHCVCVVEYGYIKMFEPALDGREMLMFIRAPQDILGLRGAAQQDGKGLRTHSAQACEDSGIICIPAEKFRTYLETHPRFALDVIEILAERLDEMCDNLSNLAVAHVASRVARIILHIGQCYGTQVGHTVDLDIPLTQQEIADMAGAARQTVSSILNTLKNDGVISVTQKHLRIEDAKRLTDLALSSGPESEVD